MVLVITFIRPVSSEFLLTDTWLEWYTSHVSSLHDFDFVQCQSLGFSLFERISIAKNLVFCWRCKKKKKEKKRISQMHSKNTTCMLTMRHNPRKTQKAKRKGICICKLLA